MRRGVDPRDRARDDDLGAEPARLLECSARQLVARHARGEAEVVLDPGGRARLATRRLALDHERPESLGGAVHGGCQAGRARADDHRVVFGGRRLGRDVEELGHPPQLRSHDRLAVHDAKDRVVAVGRQRTLPLLDVGGHVGLEPAEPDLVAIEEASQLCAGGVPPVAEHDRPERDGFGHAGSQTPGPAQPVPRQSVDPPLDLRLDGGKGAVVVRLEPEDARRLRRPVPGGLGHPERDRQLADDVTGPALADQSLLAVDEPDHLDPALEDAEQHRPVTLVRGVLAGRERDVRRHTAKPIAMRQVDVRENGDPTDLLGGHHEMHRHGWPRSVLQAIAGTPETPRPCSGSVLLDTGATLLACCSSFVAGGRNSARAAVCSRPDRGIRPAAAAADTRLG